MKGQQALLNHFTDVGRNAPFTEYSTPPFPGDITGWYKYADAYLAKTDAAQTSHFFCPVHQKW